MDNQAILEIVLQARDEATAQFAALGEKIDGVTGKTGKMNEVMATAEKGQKLVAVAALAVGAALVGITVASVKLASDFQSSMTLIQTQAGASSQEVDQMSKSVLALAGQVGFAPKVLADGLFFVESAGYRGAQALDILKLAAEGAKVGQSDLAQTANVLTTVINSGVKGVDNATQGMGALNAIVGQGKMHMEDLNGAMSTGILASAKTFGLSLQDVGGALDVMTNNGIPAVDAATRLRMTFSLMEAPTAKASGALQSIGLSQRALADDMRSGGLSKAMDDLKAHLDGVQSSAGKVEKGTKMSGEQMAAYSEKIKQAEEHIKILNETHVKAGIATEKHNLALEKAQATLKGYQDKLGSANTMIGGMAAHTLDATEKAQLLSDAFGGGRTSSAIMTLLDHTKELGAGIDGVKTHTQDFAEAWKKNQEDANTAFDKLKATVESLAIQFGNILLPAVTKVMNFFSNNLIPGIQKVTQFFKDHKDALALVAGVIGGVLTLALYALIPPLITAAASMWLFIAPLIPFILIAAAIAAGIALIVIHFQDIKNILGVVGNFFKQVWNDIQLTLKKAIDWIVATFYPGFKSEFDKIMLVINIVKDIFILAWAGITYVFKIFTDWLHTTFHPAFQASSDFLSGVLTTLSNFFTKIWNTITGVLTSFGSWINKTFGPIIQTAFNFISTCLTKLSDAWQTVWNGIAGVVVKIADGIIGTIKAMLNDVVGLINGVIDKANSVGSKLPGYTKIPDIPKFEQGGFVPSTGLAIVHQGEFVVSRDMMAGKSSMPNFSQTTNSQPITINATVNNSIDMNDLGYRLAFALRNSR